LKNYKTELLCDFAEYYRIYDFRAHPPFYVGALLRGLRAESRTMMAITGTDVPFSVLVNVAILDNLNWLRWSRTKKGTRPPKPLLPGLLNTKEDKPTAFDTAEEFERRRAEILRGAQNG